jgi:DNA mismatch repair protein MutL
MPLGKTSVGINAFPSFLFDRGVDPIEFMQELLEKADTGALRASGGGKEEGEAALREVLDMMACKAAVKAGDRMSELELTELIKLRGEVERSSNCPHGRPTSIRLTIKELEKLFGRT